eukprot:gene25161-10792_t
MGQKTKLGKNRLDKYYYLAKEQGFRSRAAFKLIQLNRKYNFLSNCNALLDLCAAPGGWLQVAAKTMPMSSLIIGIDLVPIKPVRGVKCLVGDITTQEARQLIKKEAGGNSFDVVVHDGAPNVGGAWSSEAYSQSALVLDSLRLAVESLAPKGTFVTKVFRSSDYTALLYAFNQLFDKVEATKPAASRGTSAEIFVVCLGFKAPAKIDPRLLDPKVLFADVAEPKKNMGPDALLKMKIKQKRQREGYEEGLSTSHKVASALSFLVSDSPVEMLGNCTLLALDGPDSWQLADTIRRHELSSKAEIKALCADLQVLGRSEFKMLLKWRLAMRKALKDLLPGEADEEADGHKSKKKKGKAGEAEAEAPAAAEGSDDEEAREDKVLQEMEEIKSKMEQGERREKKRRREMKKKARIRAAQMLAGDGTGDDQAEGAPTHHDHIKGAKGALGKVSSAVAPGEEELELLEADSQDEEEESSESDYDSDEDDLRYEAAMEESLDESYRSYLERKGVRADKIARKRLGMDGELDEDEDGEVLNLPEAPEENDDEEGAGMLVSLDEARAGVPATGAAMAAQWFKQDLFQDPNLAMDDEEGDQEGAEDGDSEEETNGADKDGDAAVSDDEDVGLGDAKKKLSNSSKEKAGFEEVPVEKSDSGSDNDSMDSDDEYDMLDDQSQLQSRSMARDDEYDMLNDQGKAEVLAIAKKMLRRTDKEGIINAAYHKYAFHDVHLPKWFTEDEDRHMRPNLPVTKEEVEEERARLKAIDTRPVKKVMEAKARKQKRIGVKLKQARDKATSVADQDVPMKSKMKEIEKIYAKANSQSARIKKGRGGKRVPLDSVMKKERRSFKAAEKRSGGKGKGRGGGGVGSHGGAKR